jgi:DNA invertase Pin-like site-specific DNA recombinase
VATRAGIYLRISQDQTGTAAGVKRQEEDCRALAERKGWDVNEIYCDNDVSAYYGKPRPQYLRLLDDIKNNVVDAVIVWHLDRLHRHPKELETFFEVCDAAGMKNLASVTGDVDLSTDDGRFMARILGAVARKESDDKSRRIKRKALELAKAGKVGGGGPRPFGYDDDRITVRGDEAELLREAARRILAGESLRSICSDWYERGINTTAGQPFQQSPLRRLLTKPRIAGLREHRGEVVATAEWPAILDRVTWERVRRVLLDPARKKYDGSTSRKYLLAGFTYCGECGERLASRPRTGANGRRERRYVCGKRYSSSACGRVHRMAEPIEELVIEAVFVALDSPALTKAAQTKEPTGDVEVALLDEIGADEQGLSDLARDHYVDRLIGRSEYLAAREGLEARIEANRRRLANIEGRTVVANLPRGIDAIRKAWDERGLDWRRALLGSVIEKVIVHRAEQHGSHTFDPSKIEIVWRH